MFLLLESVWLSVSFSQGGALSCFFRGKMCGFVFHGSEWVRFRVFSPRRSLMAKDKTREEVRFRVSVARKGAVWCFFA